MIDDVEVVAFIALKDDHLVGVSMHREHGVKNVTENASIELGENQKYITFRVLRIERVISKILFWEKWHLYSYTPSISAVENSSVCQFGEGLEQAALEDDNPF